MVDPDKKQIDKLVDKYDLHEIIEQDFLDFTTQDKIDVYDGCLFLVIRFLLIFSAAWRQQVFFVLMPSYTPELCKIFAGLKKI